MRHKLQTIPIGLPQIFFVGCMGMCLFFVSCTSPMERLDSQTVGLIHRTQQLSLGEENRNDPQRVPDVTAALDRRSDPYAQQPGTRNPALDELPARATEVKTPVDAEGNPLVPQMLDPQAEAVAFDLEDALAYAIENSREYRNRKEDLFLTALNLIAERHLWGPRFFNDVTAVFRGTPERGDHDQVSEIINEFRVVQRLPYGGEVSVGALVNFVNMLQDASGRLPSQTQGAVLTFDATLPLLRGAGMIAREDLIQAERNLFYEARAFERYRREFFVSIAVDYFNLISQQDRIANLKLQIEGLDRLARRFDALARAGRASYIDAEQSAAQVLFARNDLINAEENYASSLDNFKIRLGMPTSQALAIERADVYVPDIALERIDAVNVAIANRLDLQTSADMIDDAFRRVRVAKNMILPDLDLFANVDVPTDSPSDLDGGKFSFEDSRYSAGVRFGVPLDRQREWVGYRRALIDLERTRRSYTLERDLVAQEVRSSLRRIRQAKFTLELQQRNVLLAQRRKQGVALNERDAQPRDVIEAEEDLLDARNRLDAAVRDLRVSVLQFLLNSGQLRVNELGRWIPPAQLVPLDDPDPAADVPADERLLQGAQG